MRRIIIGILYAFLLPVSFLTFAQKASNRDSLLLVYQKSNRLDQKRIGIQLSQLYQSSNIDSALIFISKSYELLDENDLLELPVLLQLGVCLTENRNLEHAKEIIDKALDLADRTDDQTSLAKIYNTLGNIYYYQEKSDKALEMYRTSLEFDEKNGNKKEYLISLVNYGIILGKMGRYDDQKDTYLKSLDGFLLNDDKSNVLRTAVNLAFAYGRTEAKFYSLDSAIYFGRYALKLATELNFLFGIAKSKNILSSALIRKGYDLPELLPEGLLMAQDAQAFFMSSPYKGEYQLAKLNAGFAYEALGKTKIAIEIAREILKTDFELKQECHRLLTRCYKQNGDYRNALASFERYKIITDSLHNLNQQQQLSEIQTKYETAKKEVEISTLTQQSSIQAIEIRQKNLGIAIGLVILILVFMLIYFIYRQRSLQKERVQNSLEQRFLRSQLNPHFIFNALMAIQNFMMKNDAQQASIYLAKFAKLMRVILENSREEFIPIASEIEMLKNYLDIHKLRLNDSFDYQIVMDENIEDEVDTIPPMFVQPFVENAIEHGIITANGRGLIELNFTKQDEYISIQISDNGGGMSVGKITSSNHKSLATTIIQERMTLFNKSLKDKIQLIINDIRNETGEVQGTRVELRVPFG